MAEEYKIVNTTGLNNCGARCVIHAHVRNGTVEKITTETPAAAGDDVPLCACAKGLNYHKTFLGPDRLRYPMKRVGERGEGKFQRISWAEATLMIAPAKKQEQPLPRLQEVKKQEITTTYRTHLHGENVDALPQVRWPAKCEEIRRCVEEGMPTYVLPHPWRFATVPGTKGQCAAGRYIQDGRITKTAVAVRARGGLIQPKGLQGYSYVRTEADQSYWMLIREFT